jgi:hypothetical protein
MAGARLHGLFSSARVYRDTTVHLAFTVLGIEQAETHARGFREERPRSVWKSPGLNERRVVVSDELRAQRKFRIFSRVSQLPNWRMLRKGL